MQPNDAFIESIKESLLLHLEDEVDLYCEQFYTGELDGEDQALLQKYLDYAVEKLFAN